MSAEYYPNHRLKNSGTMIGVSYGNESEKFSETGYGVNEEKVISSTDDGNENSNSESFSEMVTDLTKSEDDFDLKEKDSIIRNVSYSWGPPGGWVCFAGGY